MSSVIQTHDDWTPWYERTKAELARLADEITRSAQALKE